MIKKENTELNFYEFIKDVKALTDKYKYEEFSYKNRKLEFSCSDGTSGWIHGNTSLYLGSSLEEDKQYV